MSTYQYWARNNQSSEVYAVRLDDQGKVIEANGPLDYADVYSAALVDTANNAYEPELADDLENDKDSYHVLTIDRADDAERRIDFTPALHQYGDLLLRYDWPNYDEHLTWVANAPLEEILSWARGIRENEQP